MAKRNYIYCAGPYLGDNAHHDYRSYFRIHANIMRVHEVALALASLGYGFFAPHVHSMHNEVIAPHLPPEYWYELDNHFLRACDAILVLSGESAGTAAEILLAYSLEMPVFFSFVDLVNAIPPFDSIAVHACKSVQEK